MTASYPTVEIDGFDLFIDRRDNPIGSGHFFRLNVYRAETINIQLFRPELLSIAYTNHTPKAEHN